MNVVKLRGVHKIFVLKLSYLISFSGLSYYPKIHFRRASIRLKELTSRAEQSSICVTCVIINDLLTHQNVDLKTFFCGIAVTHRHFLINKSNNTFTLFPEKYRNKYLFGFSRQLGTKSTTLSYSLDQEDYR